MDNRKFYPEYFFNKISLNWSGRKYTHPLFCEDLDERDLGFEEMPEEDFKDPHLRKIIENGIKVEKIYDE